MGWYICSGNVLPSNIVLDSPLTNLELRAMPTKTTFTKGTALDLTGLLIAATYENGTTQVVTDYTSTPPNGTVLENTGTQIVTITYENGGVTRTVSFNIYVPEYSIVSWSSGTDEEIVAMVQAADEGKINLSDYWAVGDERTVHLLATDSISGSGAIEGQDVVFVLMDTDCLGFNLTEATASNRTKPSFIAGMKNCLKTTGCMNITGTNSNGWSGCLRRTWCNNEFYNAVPSTFRSIFKQFTWQQGKGGSSSGLLTTQDYFGLAPEMAICGSQNYSYPDEAVLYTQWNWYQTASNRTKTVNGSGSYWWTCSPNVGTYNTEYFCSISHHGASATLGQYMYADSAYGLSPFGCI